MAAQKFTVDLNKPIVCQVGHLGKTYQGWVHQPILTKDPRFFESDFLEFFSRTVWWAVPTIWLPVAFWGNTMHYLLHGTHHKHPMDGLRLVMPPAETAVLAITFWYLYKLLFTPSTRHALFGGTLIGYVMYDVIHYYVHHGHPTKQIPKNLKKYHLNHHFRIQNKGFGVTSALWDTLFGTFP